MKKRVIIAGTIYPVLLYLLHNAREKTDADNVFFIGEGISVFAKNNSNVIVIKNFKNNKNTVLRKFFGALWILTLRIKKATVWRKYFKNAEIYAQDHFPFSSVLIGKSNYTYISDGFNNFNTYMISDLYKDSVKRRSEKSINSYIHKLLCGPIWMGYFCFNNQCIAMLHENPIPVPYVKHCITPIKVDIQKIWNSIDHEQKLKICQFFDISANELDAISEYETLLLAQNFESIVLTEEELIEIYKKALSNYDESKLMIKTHHFGKINYKKYFPNAFVLDKPIPMQLLILAGEKNSIKTAITINSTAVSLLDKNTEIVWLGEKIHPKILAFLGNLSMQDVVFCSKK